MMKYVTRRRLVTFGLAAALALSLTACGEKRPSQEEVEQAIEAGTLTIEDALDKGWIDQAWVDATTTTLSGEDFTREQLGDVVFFAFLDPNAEGTQTFYDTLAEGYDGVVENGADIVVCTKSESGNELFAEAPFPVILYNDSLPVILYNDSLKAAIGGNSGMVEDEETPNTASWYVNGSFLSAWYSSVDAEELPASAAAFAEMSREPAFEGGDGSGAAAMAPMG